MVFNILLKKNKEFTDVLSLTAMIAYKALDGMFCCVIFFLLSICIVRERDTMKLAVSGKGGVGKTTFSALLIRTLDNAGKHVLAIDADPDANLAAALGIEGADKIVPIADMKELIFERTEAKPGSIGGFFKLNPKVDDLPDPTRCL